MPFTLSVSQAGGESEEFSFEGGEARLGRTADNDVVIKDPSSSRSHARVWEEDGRYFVEDLKSANGTKLNAKVVKGPLQLEAGDRIMIGDVTLLFSSPEANATMMVAPGSTVDEAGEEDEANATILKPPTSKPNAAAISRRPPPRRPTPPPAEEPEADDPPPDEDDGADSTRDFKVPPPKSLQRRPTGAVARASRAQPSAHEPAALSASDRARQRRELQRSSVGRAQLLWSDLSKPARIVVGLIGSIATIAGLGLVVMAVMPKKVAKRAEPVALVANGDPIPESFGEGEDVDFSRPDMKTFTVSYASPTAIVGVLHYQARDCAKDEVTIELNGGPVGSVPPDTVEVATRQLEVILPSSQLKIGDPNEIVFDNVNNPPAEDPWRIWNVWVEVIPIPVMSAEDASRRAKEDIERGSRLYEMRDVGAMNLFRAWKQYRDAWLLLEATPDRPTDLLQISRTRMREIRPELDRKCSAMLVDYQKEMTQKYANVTAARKVLQNIPAHFEKEHPCFGMSRFLLRGLDDFGEPE